MSSDQVELLKIKPENTNLGGWGGKETQFSYGQIFLT